ncbi:ABC transporter permease [Tumebacillus flagellatus]|uniref:Bacitracin ABC transporter permease n=1 Tax=Tumebacillus flagellatus TaxID=1157490 RepID=A0A074M928_9BACL|nr:ABC transporter permease [Tumebacillus flagellatus]KEO82462.1 hypothetical protein EL26_15400 [Tumebacillus flagellatus]
MWRILASDSLKLRRTWIVALTLLTPVGLMALMTAAYTVSYDTLVKPGQDNWATLIQILHVLTVFSLMLGSGILASIFLGIEHQGHTWKQLMALPISRFQLLVGKFLWLAAMLGISSLLLAVGYVLFGLGFDLGPTPWKMILTECFAPCLAVLPVLALQVWLSSVFHNQALPVLLSVVGMLLSGSASLLPSWLPWSYPQYASPVGHDPKPWLFALLGLGVACAVVLAGASHFAKREVK